MPNVSAKQIAQITKELLEEQPAVTASGVFSELKKRKLIRPSSDKECITIQSTISTWLRRQFEKGNFCRTKDKRNLFAYSLPGTISSDEPQPSPLKNCDYKDLGMALVNMIQGFQNELQDRAEEVRAQQEHITQLERHIRKLQERLREQATKTPTVSRINLHEIQEQLYMLAGKEDHE